MFKKLNFSRMQIAICLLVVNVAFLVEASKLKKIQSLTIQSTINNSSNMNDTTLTNRNRRQICNT